MKRIVFIALFPCLMLGVAPSVHAADNDQAGIAIHIAPLVTKNICSTAPPITAGTVQAFAPGANGDSYTAYIFVCNGSDSTGVAGAEFGIDYDGNPNIGVDVDGWTLCGDLEFPNVNWPNANTGTIITWNPGTNCQNTPSEPFVPRTVVALLGAFNVTAYSPDAMMVIPRPISGFAKVADCAGSEDDINRQAQACDPLQLGIASFGNSSAYNPCGLVTMVETTTWGGIKRTILEN